MAWRGLAIPAPDWSEKADRLYARVPTTSTADAANRATTNAPHRAPQRSACVDLLTCLSSWLSWFVDRFRIGSLCRYFDATMAGGLHVPSPGGRIEGGVSFGQYRRITR